MTVFCASRQSFSSDGSACLWLSVYSGFRLSLSQKSVDLRALSLLVSSCRALSLRFLCWLLAAACVALCPGMSSDVFGCRILSLFGTAKSRFVADSFGTCCEVFPKLGDFGKESARRVQGGQKKILQLIKKKRRFLNICPLE